MQVCLGEATAAKIMGWAKNKYSGKLRLKVSISLHTSRCRELSCRAHGINGHQKTNRGVPLQARSVPDECESADALRMVADDITAQSFVVMSVDLITDVRLEASLTKSS